MLRITRENSVTYSFVYKTYELPDDDLSKIETRCDAECNNTHVKNLYIILCVRAC
jgi:hypothetical protein